MDSKEAVFLIEKLRQHITVELNLSDTQEFVLHRCLLGLSYQDIADLSGYDHDYIKQTGAKLWRSLSTVLERKVTKSNIRNVLNQYWQEKEKTNPSPQSFKPEITTKKSLHDWGDAIDVSSLFGRESELDLCKKWILNDGGRLIAVLGMGGVGKTALVSKLAKDIAKEFKYVVWRSLRNATPFMELLGDLIALVSGQKETNIPDSVDPCLDLLMHHLSISPCLIILDNLESILRSRQTGGHYRQSYEGYGQLLRRIADEGHQSCLIITSREQPIGISLRKGEDSPVSTLQLMGLSTEEGQKILADKNVISKPDSISSLVQMYSGNPLALKIVSATIEVLFNGKIDDFISQGSTVFGDIWDLLEQQFDRLTPLEQKFMYWLAIARDPLSMVQLRQNLVHKVPTRVLLKIFQSLQGRSLIEIHSLGCTQQPVVMEYVTARLIEQLHQEIITQELDLFISLPLIQAQSSDRIRQAQTSLILEPLVDSILITIKKKSSLREILDRLVEQLRGQSFLEAGYGVGNIINLLGHLDSDLRGKDFSNLSICQAYLADKTLSQANFAHSNFKQSRFAETFGSVTCISFSADGKLLATGHTSGEMNVWEVNGDKRLISIRGKAFWIWAFVFSPDGSMLASAGDDSLVSLWDARTGKCLATLEGHSFYVNTLVFTPDSNFLLSAGLDKTIKIWDVRHLRNLSAAGILKSSHYKDTYIKTLTGHSDRVWHIALSPDGQTLASASEDMTIKLWNIKTGQCLQTLTGHQHWVWCVNFSSDGKWLASGSYDRTVKLWDVATGYCLKTFCGHQDHVLGVNFSPDNQRLASGSYDRTIKLWDVATGYCLKTFRGHLNRIWSISLSSNGRLLASGGDDNTIKFWNFKTGECLKTIQGYANATQEIDLSPDGRILASGHDDQTIKLWDLKTGQIYQTLRGHNSRVWSIAFTPPNSNKWELLASGSFDYTIKVWDWHNNQCLHTLEGHLSWIWRVAFSPDAQILASASYDQTIKLWNPKTGRCLNTLTGHQGPVAGVEFSPDGKKLVSCSFDQTIKLWELDTGKCINTLEGHSDNLWTTVFSPNNQLLASCSYDRTIKLWDAKTGKCLNTLIGHTEPVTKLSFGLDSNRLVSCSYDRTIKLWDVTTGKCMQTFRGHTDIVSGLIFGRSLYPSLGTSHAATLISCSFDRTIKLWDLGTGKCLHTLQPPRPYEDLNINGIKGLTSAEVSTLKSLGAKE